MQVDGFAYYEAFAPGLHMWPVLLGPVRKHNCLVEPLCTCCVVLPSATLLLTPSCMAGISSGGTYLSSSTLRQGLLSVLVYLDDCAHVHSLKYTNIVNETILASMRYASGQRCHVYTHNLYYKEDDK